ncbi:ThiF family adenylyltransferase [Ferruginibacter sp.]
MKNPKIKVRIPKAIYEQAFRDLLRPHEFAFERIGFFCSKSKRLKNETILITITKYLIIDDKNYIEDGSVGARINSAAIRSAMQSALDSSSGIFHVHMHDHTGKPGLSYTDRKEIPDVIDSFYNVVPNQAHGLIILSQNSAIAEVKLHEKRHRIIPESISIVGYPMKSIFLFPIKHVKSNLYDRQSFLGPDSQMFFENVKVGIVGFGGGGSHVGQQLAHIGIKNVTVFDDDKIEHTNMNRLIGGWFSDIKNKMLKTSIAKRLFKKILPSSNIKCINDKWQNKPEDLQECDFIVGGVDTFIGREQLEAECRRYLIPYLDIGMDVYQILEEAPSIHGQVILSMPGMPCMKCIGFLTDEKLKKEAAKYGDVGGHPQVVWSNGVLASTAVGILIDLITGWTKQKDRLIYLSYDGNSGSVQDHVRIGFVEKTCVHYNLGNTGEPQFISL